MTSATAINEATTMQGLSATYSPEDNKLRLYSGSRLDADLYSRVKSAGFKWAPKQGFFVAPMWTPARADLLTELCGEIGDEDTGLVERAEERAERFEGYQENRASDAEAARNAVSSIAEHIPFGQPILVGHHSERRARKDAERIENGMRKAVKMWETSQYWESRAAGALRHAKYKELPDVRHRRIKGLEADKRKQERTIEEAETFLKMWTKDGLTLERAKAIANYNHVNVQEEGKSYSTSIWSMLEDGKMTAEEAAQKAIAANTSRKEWAQRWLDHYNNRIAYERAMLDEQGGVASDRFNIEVGGRVLIGGEWLVVMRVNKKGGVINSVTTNARYVRVRGIEEVKDYKAPEADEVAKVKAATKLHPLCNYPGDGFLEMTKAEYDKKHKDYKRTRVAQATETHGAHRYREAFLPNAGYKLVQVFLTDAKRVDPPALATAPAEPVTFERQIEATEPRPVYEAPHKNEFDAMRDQLKEGVKVVAVPQLFPTSPETSARMVEIADIKQGQDMLEPSVGTGNIVNAIAQVVDLADINLTTVEINHHLSAIISARFKSINAVCLDFMQFNVDYELKFDRILMNPPFADYQDIEHIKHAYNMLKPGGRLVAICANGPRQNAELRSLVEQCGGEWEDLPPNTFKHAHTSVNTALLLLTK
jgi:phospholipid N-methyltransferase